MRLDRQLTVTAVLFCVATALPAQEQPAHTVAELASKIDTQIPTRDETAQHSDHLPEELAQLQGSSIMVFGARKRELADKVRELQQLLTDVKTAGGENHKATLDQMSRLWAEIKSLYPKEALQKMPPLWSCPMHQELIEQSAGKCPICGMALEPIYVTQPQLTQTSIIRAELVTKTPLEVGKRADLTLRLLFNDTAEPVRLSDLEDTHTRKIHLLISDISETDYHHEHPQPVGDGEYAFSFTPHRPDTYRIWADLMPVRTRVQQYSVADIPSTTPRQAKLASNEPENRHAEVDGYRFELEFDREIVHEKETVSGKLHVTQPDGRPCDKLDVVMGAFGHLVGFCDDFATVLHIHPLGEVIDDATRRGGPDLQFYFRSNRTGIVRLFAQVKIEGKDFFPRFIVKVQPLQHLPGT